MSNENEAIATEENDAPTAAEENDAQAQARKILEARKAKTAAAPKEEGSTETKAKAPKEPKEPKVAGKRAYKFLRDLDANDKLNNQQKMVVDAMLKLVKNEGDEKGLVYHDELLAELGEVLPGSRQPTVRVIAFYMNSWTKTVAATEKKPEIAPLFSRVTVVFKAKAPEAPAAA